MRDTPPYRCCATAHRPITFVSFRDAFVSDDVAGPQGAELGRRTSSLLEKLRRAEPLRRP